MTLDEYLQRFVIRAMQEALASATPEHWLRRAEEWERAKPVEPPGGFKNPEQARVQWRRCHATAMAMRHRAAVARDEAFEILPDLLFPDSAGRAEGMRR